MHYTNLCSPFDQEPPRAQELGKNFYTMAVIVLKL